MIMENVIKKILENKDLSEIYDFAKKKLFAEGPTSITVLEILSYLCLYAPDFFTNVTNEILEMMGVFYKRPIPISLQSAIFNMYGEHIKERHGENYTPIQASILQKIQAHKNFSFSAPTSTGKSYIFRHLIECSRKDVVIIVPSRALINEYYDRVCKLVQDKTVNILTFVEIINTKHAKRTIFILTPERARDILKYKENLDIEFFLFDEAQLSDEESIRGLFFDSIVRRVQKGFPCAKCVFAHPFIKNPSAQLEKNNFEFSESESFQYNQKNVGQIFLAHDGQTFYHFGIDKSIMGPRKIPCNFDPLIRIIENNGSILIYTTKASIYDRSVFKNFASYIAACKEITDPRALDLIMKITQYIGATDSYYHSNMMEMLRRGIVIHHGSLPLNARLILEHFTQEGFCRICFATSTLEQGINMPFDAVYLNTFAASKTLSMKNMIGRAGRSTNDLKFDYGYVIVKPDNISAFRQIMLHEEDLKTVSLLDIEDQEAEYEEFKEAINSGEYSDEFNLTNMELERLTDRDIDFHIERTLTSLFKNGELIPLTEINRDERSRLPLYNNFAILYRFYLNGRVLSNGEVSVLNTAIRILIWKIYCRTFKDICWSRYAYAAQVQERRRLIKLATQASDTPSKERYERQARELEWKFIRGFDDIPDINLANYGIYPKGTKAMDVDYDRIVCDTYDYLDKLIGFKLSDIYYAIFYKYYGRTHDMRAKKMANYVRYGTDDSQEILMLRYGLSFEEIEYLKKHIKAISTEEIVFLPSINELSPEQLSPIERFIVLES